MIIQNKASNKTEYITPDQWERLKRIGYQKNWIVIDSSDSPPDDSTIIPAKILDFVDMRSDIRKLNEMLKRELIVYAEENNIEINPRDNKETILKTIKDERIRSANN